MGFDYENAASQRRRGRPLSTEASDRLALEMKRLSKLGHYGDVSDFIWPSAKLGKHIKRLFSDLLGVQCAC